tara:strand:- start:725 stop:919 length:195 start_codon:yes stop_codon:yes gene_type:complete
MEKGNYNITNIENNEITQILNIIKSACRTISYVIKMSNNISLSKSKNKTNISGDVINKIDDIAN